MLYGAGKEFIDASRQLGSFFRPEIIVPVLLMLILSTWLIGSGLSREKLKFKSLAFLKYFGISFVIFAIVAFFSLSSYVVPKNFVTINGLKIPLGKCIDGNVRVIPNEEERKEYCECYVEKITNDPELKAKYQLKLEGDKANDVFKEIQSSPKFLELGIDECLNSVSMKWTDNVAKSMKENWIKELTGTEFETTNNINEYCDCLIDAYREYPMNKIMTDKFLESQEAIGIDEKCTELSRK
ncbi:hypothetical protein [Dokdonia sp. Hel_I_53]|uniref:hypothetical protein n=1 Tax=Dokdonia sp. Hel_I_53 TaxID=1566287 RepID=UPI00119AEC29|nr:hypothetical protein [Dokdonia sp. Hel_I_53]TVZ51674.1 hypothetical protein OD90_0822 [Dokdonia sp. Hel_I_53]